MRANDVKKMLKAEPFQPVRLGLSDGRSVVIRHPDQVVVAERHVLIGLARLEISPPLATPESGDTIARDWLVVNLFHISTIEPAEANGASRQRRRRKG